MGVTDLFFEENEIKAKKSAILKRHSYHSNDSNVIFVKKLYSSNSDFTNSVLFAVPTRKNY